MKNTQHRNRADRAREPVDPVSGLTPTEREDLRSKLVARREAIHEAARVHLDAVHAGERTLGDDMDQATLNHETGVVLRIADKEQKLLTEVDAALAKFDKGTYGVCEGTGDPIGYARLAVRPWARHGIAYKELLERERWEERQRGH
jgi:DnaK suppressor protein